MKNFVTSHESNNKITRRKAQIIKDPNKIQKSQSFNKHSTYLSLMPPTIVSDDDENE